MVLATGSTLELPADSLFASADGWPPAEPLAKASARPHAASLNDAQKQHILQALERCSWVIEGPRGAAQLLGLQPSTLRSRMKKLGIHQRPASASSP
jgi:transcriptional regulator with GAF, ATPase, and Fis domain